VLAGLNALKSEDLNRALIDSDEHVRASAVRLSAQRLRRDFLAQSKSWIELLKIRSDSSLLVRYQLAWALGDLKDPQGLDALAGLIRRDTRERWMQAAVLNSTGCFDGEQSRPAGETSLLLALARDETFMNHEQGLPFLEKLAAMAGLRQKEADIQSVLEWLADQNSLEPAASIVHGLAEGLKQAGRSLEEVDTNRALDPFFQQVTAIISDPDVLEPDRIQAIRLAGLLSRKDTQDLLLRTVVGDSSLAIRRAAWSALRRKPTDDLAKQLMKRWADLPDFAQREGLGILLSPDSRALEMLAMVRQEVIAKELFSAAQRESLRSHRNQEIRREAVDMFGTAQTVEARMNELQPVLTMTGRPEAGRTIYLERCASCHRLGEDGHELGPDLATVKNGGPEKILLSLLDPNREVSPNFIQYDIDTRDGETLSGIIASETTAGLTIRQANGVETLLARANVAAMRSTGRSPMPEGLTEGLSSQDVADLLAFLLK
jgi:putative heme-binding domain-containing protein